jgi:hypothetical protein
MRTTWKSLLTGVALAATALTPSVSLGQLCGDINNDGSVTVADGVLLANCAAGAGSCPAAVTECGNDNLLTCGDVFGDGSVAFPAALLADVDALIRTLTGQPTLYQPCQGPATIPDLAGCPGTVTLNSQTLTTSQTWPAGCTVKLNGTVFVADGVTLRLEPGAVVQGIKTAPEPPALIFLTGSKIDAQGTPAAPIVFTSDQPAGTRDKGDWAGVMFNGKGIVNDPPIPGQDCLNQAEGIPTAYGGCDSSDSSGVARYVRVEYCGLDFTPNNELNVWTMNAIGANTDFNFIQAHAGGDDCHEWFGGNAAHTNMVATACGDDGLDFQLGWQGSLQFGLMVQSGVLTDSPPIRDSRGIEGDNNEFGNDLLGLTGTLRSNGDMCNITVVGGGFQSGANDGSDSGVLLRRGTAGDLMNWISVGFGDAGFEIRDTATAVQLCESTTVLRVDDTCANDNSDCTGAGAPCTCCTGLDTGFCETALLPQNGAIFGNATAYKSVGTCGTPAQLSALLAAENVTTAVDPGIPFTVYPAAGDLFDARADVGTGTPGDCATLNPRFITTGYLGALDPSASCTTAGPGAACDWLTQPWISFDLN